jgi:hypothetical protein
MQLNKTLKAITFKVNGIAHNEIWRFLKQISDYFAML